MMHWKSQNKLYALCNVELQDVLVFDSDMSIQVLQKVVCARADLN
jgi:hypothetical protein